MFNFGNFFTKKNNAVITSDLTEIKKKHIFVVIKVCCASNADIKNVKIARKNNYFPNTFTIKS